MAGKYMRGAFVEFMPAFPVPLPNVIPFQYNPESMTHTWTPPEAPAPESSGRSNPLAVRGVPGETFAFTLAMDAADMIADGGPVAEGLATARGIYTRLAALEMLLYPVPAAGGGQVGSVSVSNPAGLSAGGAGRGVQRSVPDCQVPTVLFIWGPGRVLPVRLTSLVITENLYDELLNPTHAEAVVNLRVLTPEELQFVTGPLRQIAKGAYSYSQGLRQTLAALNLANAAASTIGMLPV